MTIRILAAALIAAAFTFGPAPDASAKTLKLTPKDPIAIVDAPDGWLTQEIDRGVEIKTKDEEVILWFEAYRPDQFKAVMDEHTAYFTKQGVKITGEPTTATGEEKGASVTFLEFPATWNGKPTVLRYMSYDLKLPSKKLILMSYWASPEGHKRYAPQMKKLTSSFTPLAQ